MNGPDQALAFRRLTRLIPCGQSVTNELALDLLIDLALSYPNNDHDPSHDVRVSSPRLAGPGRGNAVPGPDRWVTMPPGYGPLCTPESFRA